MACFVLKFSAIYWLEVEPVLLVSFSIEDYLFVVFDYSTCMYRGTRFQYQHGSQTIVVLFIRVQSLNVSLGDLTW